MTTTSNMRYGTGNRKLMLAGFAICIAVAAYLLGYVNGHDAMRAKCNSIVASRLPVPPVPIIYLSREE